MKQATIASGQTVSDAVALELDNSPVALTFPAAMTGATVTLQTAADGTNYLTIQQVGGGGDYSVTVTASRYVPLDPRVVKGVRNLKVVSASAEAAERLVGIVTDPLA